MEPVPPEAPHAVEPVPEVQLPALPLRPRVAP